MYIFLVTLIIIVCVLLAIVVLVQNSKGGGLAANFSAPNQIMGVRKTTDFMEKSTWWLAIILVVLSLAATAAIPHQGDDGDLKTEVSVNDNVSPVQQPAAQPAAEAAQPAADQQ